MAHGYETESPKPFALPSRIPHYYGDFVRILFVVAAALSAVAIPVWGDILFVGTFTQVAAIVILVFLAGLTNPHSKLVLWADVAISAFGALFVEVTAISYYSMDLIAIFLVREVLMLLFLFALYFSIKTLRAMQMHTIGHEIELGEFDEPLGSDD